MKSSIILKESYTLIVPRTAKMMGIRAEAIREMTLIAGGVTITEGEGTWVDANENVIQEPNTQIEVFYADGKQGAQLATQISALADRMLQAGEECVAVKVNNRHLILFFS